MIVKPPALPCPCERVHDYVNDKAVRIASTGCRVGDQREFARPYVLDLALGRQHIRLAFGGRLAGAKGKEPVLVIGEGAGLIVNLIASAVVMALVNAPLQHRLRRVLLQDMGQFMCQEPPAAFRAGGVLLCAEHNMPANGVGIGPHGAGRCCRLGVCVDAHCAKILAKSPFHGRAHICGQRLPSATEDLVDDGRGNRWRSGGSKRLLLPGTAQGDKATHRGTVAGQALNGSKCIGGRCAPMCGMCGSLPKRGRGRLQ